MILDEKKDIKANFLVHHSNQYVSSSLAGSVAC